jgi:hypothetical protein
MNPTHAAALLRALGLLDENQRRAFDRAREDDPVIRHLYGLLDPAAVDPPQALADLAEALAAERVAEQEEQWTHLLSFVSFQRLARPERADSPLRAGLAALDPGAFGGLRRELAFPIRGAVATREPTMYPAVSLEEQLGQQGSEVFLDCPEGLAPHGLGWLLLTESVGTVTLHLPVLQLNRDSGKWWFSMDVRELLGGRPPVGVQVRVAFLPATERTREAFDGGEVRDFVRRLPENCPQRQRAEQFLDTKEPEHGGR